MAKSSKEKQDQRKAEMQAAAERDGFETWSQALTAWKNGEARLTQVAADECQHVWRAETNGEYFVLSHICDKCGTRR